MKDKKVLFIINGFSVKENSEYLIKDKPDPNAPSGFQALGMSKVPGDGISEKAPIRYIMADGATTGVWDTGLYEYSPCYKGRDIEEVRKEILNLEKNLIEPYKRATGIKEIGDQNDNSFWEKPELKADLFTKRIFSTSSPIQTMELYIALRSYNLAPKGKEREALYRTASYIVSDSTKEMKVKDEKAANHFKIIRIFGTMLEIDRSTLLLILNYMNMPVSEDIEDITLMGMFDEHLKQYTQSGDQFLKLSEESESESGKAKLDIYKKLREEIYKGGKVLKTPAGVLFYDGVEIGPDLKSASENIAKNSDLVAIKKEILLRDED